MSILPVCVCVLGGGWLFCQKGAGCEGVSSIPHHYDQIPAEAVHCEFAKAILRVRCKWLCLLFWVELETSLGAKQRSCVGIRWASTFCFYGSSFSSTIRLYGSLQLYGKKHWNSAHWSGTVPWFFSPGFTLSTLAPLTIGSKREVR